MENNFDLSKVKLDPKGGLKADYTMTANVDGTPAIIERSESSTRDVHPDLHNLFVKLRRIVGDVFGLTAFLPMLEQIEIPAAKINVAKSWADGLLEKIDVRGVSWSGNDANTGVVVTAVFETPNGQKTCVNTPRIKVSGESFGFEEDLAAITDAIKIEVYKYLFEGKQAQLQLFGQNPDDVPEM